MSRILVIDDDPTLLGMYELIFSEHGYQVTAVADPEIGLEKASSEHPDLILLDIMMPKIDGLKILTKLKAVPETEEIPVLAFSNLADEKFANLALEKGAIDYIIKSDYKPQQLLTYINTILEEDAKLNKNQK